jgi:hypothetical protein
MITKSTSPLTWVITEMEPSSGTYVIIYCPIIDIFREIGS